MGQQQLLLLVLGIVIVGIAILVGINAYSENFVKSNWDSLLQDALRMASDAQAWKVKPELFGGSPDSTKSNEDDFSEAEFLSMGYAGVRITNAGLCYSNVNGVFGIHRKDNHMDVEGVNRAYGNVLRVKLVGAMASQIELKEDKSIKGFVEMKTGNLVSDIDLPRGCD